MSLSITLLSLLLLSSQSLARPSPQLPPPTQPTLETLSIPLKLDTECHSCPNTFCNVPRVYYSNMTQPYSPEDTIPANAKPDQRESKVEIVGWVEGTSINCDSIWFKTTEECYIPKTATQPVDSSWKSLENLPRIMIKMRTHSAVTVSAPPAERNRDNPPHGLNRPKPLDFAPSSGRQDPSSGQLPVPQIPSPPPTSGGQTNTCLTTPMPLRHWKHNLTDRTFGVPERIDLLCRHKLYTGKAPMAPGDRIFYKTTFGCWVRGKEVREIEREWEMRECGDVAYHWKGQWEVNSETCEAGKGI